MPWPPLHATAARACLEGSGDASLLVVACDTPRGDGYEATREAAMAAFALAKGVKREAEKDWGRVPTQ